MPKRQLLVCACLLLFFSAISSGAKCQPTAKLKRDTFTVFQLNDSLLKFRDQRFIGLSLMYLNSIGRPLDSGQHLLLKGVLSLLKDGSTAELVLGGILQSPIAELDYPVSELMAIPQVPSGAAHFLMVVQAATALKGRFVEEKMTQILEDTTGLRKYSGSAELCKSLWAALISLDQYSYVNQCLRFYWNSTDGFTFLESNKATQAFIRQVILNYTKSSEHLSYFKSFIQAGYGQNKRRGVSPAHDLLTNYLNDRCAVFSSPVAISIRLRLIDGLDDERKRTLRTVARGSIVNRSWLFPIDILSDKALLDSLQITEIKGRCLPMVLNKNKYNALHDFFLKDSAYYWSRNLTKIHRRATLKAFFGLSDTAFREEFIYEELGDQTKKDYGLTTKPRGNTLYVYGGSFINWESLKRAVVRNTANFLNELTNGYDQEPQAELVVHQELINLAIDLNFLLQSNVGTRTVQYDSGKFLSSIRSAMESARSNLPMQTQRVPDNSLNMLRQDDPELNNRKLRNYINLHPNADFSLTNRKIDIGGEKFIEQLRVTDAAGNTHLFTYTGSIPLIFLSALSGSANIFDASNYSLALREIKLGKTQYVREVQDYFDKICLYPLDFIEDALSLPPNSAMVNELFDYEHDFTNFRMWNVETQRNLSYLVRLVGKTPEENYVPYAGDAGGEHDPSKLYSMRYFTHATNTKEFSDFEETLNGALAQNIQYYAAAYMWAPGALGQIRRLPDDQACKFPDIFCYTGLITNENRGKVGAINQYNKIIQEFNNNFYKYSDWTIIGMNSCPLTVNNTYLSNLRTIADSGYDNFLTIYGVRNNDYTPTGDCWGFSYSFLHTKPNLRDNTKILLSKFPNFFNHRWLQTNTETVGGRSYKIDGSGLYKNAFSKMGALADNIINESYGYFNSVYYLQNYSLLPLMGRIFLTPSDTANSILIGPVKPLYKTDAGFWLNRQIAMVNAIYKAVRSDEDIEANTMDAEVFNMLIKKEAYKRVSDKVNESVDRLKQQIDISEQSSFNFYIGASSNGNLTIQVNGFGVNANFSNPILVQPFVPAVSGPAPIPLVIEIVNP